MTLTLAQRDFLEHRPPDHVQRRGERPAIHHHALAVGDELGIDDGCTDARLPGESVAAADRHVTCPRGIAAYKPLSQHLPVLDGHAAGVAYALARVVIQPHGDILPLHSESFEVDDYRVRKAGDPHQAA
ncbi:MAG TPA: hypothetical protein VM487_02485 [Phycisphaerae bacterium]|nr:hypothetical protein [Phycisphaerae bacterium]